MSGAFRGGDKLRAKLLEIAQQIKDNPAVDVGFFADATYPNGGPPVAYVALIQEYGATWTVKAHQTTIYRSVNKSGDFNKNGRFVKRDKANFATDHMVPEHSITIPPRPFFRAMITNGKDHWGADLGRYIVKTGYDAAKAMSQIGLQMEEELQTSIRDWSDPPNAPSTIAKKGFNKPLIDTGQMMRSVTYKVQM